MAFSQSNMMKRSMGKIGNTSIDEPLLSIHGIGKISKSDASFIDRIVPLIQGTAIYKKFT